MTASSAQMKGEFVFVDTIKSKTYTDTTGNTVTVSAAGAVSYA